MTDHVIVDSSTCEIICEHCGERVPMPVGALRWFLTVSKAFLAEHADCPRYPMDRKRDRPLCGFSEVKEAT